jgi:hypothetical protein
MSNAAYLSKLLKRLPKKGRTKIGLEFARQLRTASLFSSESDKNLQWKVETVSEPAAHDREADCEIDGKQNRWRHRD